MKTAVRSIQSWEQFLAKKRLQPCMAPVMGHWRNSVDALALGASGGPWSTGGLHTGSSPVCPIVFSLTTTRDIVKSELTKSLITNFLVLTRLIKSAVYVK